MERDTFGNLRVDETDADLAASDRFTVVLEAIDNGDGTTLGGVYGAAGSGGAVVTGKLEFDAERGVFLAEYVPFVAGTHLLNVTFQASVYGDAHYRCVETKRNKGHRTCVQEKGVFSADSTRARYRFTAALS